MKPRLFLVTGIFILYALGVASGARWAIQSGFRSAVIETCDLVTTHYFKKDQQLASWKQQCLQSAADAPSLWRKSEMLNYINSILSALRVSHLFLYNPDENRVIWEHEGLDTGIRARAIDGYFVIVELVPQSPAEIAGLKPGDVVTSVNGYDPGTPGQLQTAAGIFAVERGSEHLEIEVQPSVIKEDLGPSLKPVNERVGLLRIPSFLPTYFDRSEWRQRISALDKFSSLIVDVRGNSGGSFPAMLRAASTLHCQGHMLGKIVQPKPELGEKAEDLVDDLSTDRQLNQLASNSEVRLKTFADYGCFRGRITVLVDSDTSSVAEIFAQSFLATGRSRVWGTPTGGQVVMAQWFHVTSFGGDDYSVSIPIAGFLTAAGRELEAEGLTPERELFYGLDEARRGLDSWVLDAAIR